MAIMEITSFSGISDFADKGIPGAFKFGTNLDVRKIQDTLSSGQALVDEGLDQTSVSASSTPSVSPSLSPSASVSSSASATPSPSASPSPSSSVSHSASLSPSSSPSAATASVYEDLVLWFVKASDGNVYEFGDAGRIYRRDPTGEVIKVYTDTDGRIRGAAEAPSQQKIFYLYWATGTKLHRKQLPGLSNWTDVDGDVNWPKTNLTQATWHTMVEVGGSLHIANKEALALVGYDGSYTNETVDLVPGNEAKTLVERNGRVIIGTVRTADPTYGINASIDSEVPLSQIGLNGEVYFANMVDTISTKQFPGGGQVNPGGVCNLIEKVNFFEWTETAVSWIDKQALGNMSMWGVYGADSGKNGVYSYGRLNKNDPFTMNLDYELDVDEIGAVTSIAGTVLVSYKDGANYGVKKSSSTLKAIGTYEGLELKPRTPKRSVNITEWTTAEIQCKELPAGTSIEFQYKLDNATNWTTAYMEDLSSSFSATGETQAVFFIEGKGDIVEPRIILNPSGNVSPEIHKLRLYFN